MVGLLRIAAVSAFLLPPPCFAISAEVAFSPNGGATELVEKTIREAHSSIRVAAYSFTSKPIAAALLDASKHGIDVRVVVDKSQATARYTAATFLANQGVPVRADYRYAIMHDKFIVVDGRDGCRPSPPAVNTVEFEKVRRRHRTSFDFVNMDD